MQYINKCTGIILVLTWLIVIVVIIYLIRISLKPIPLYKEEPPIKIETGKEKASIEVSDIKLEDEGKKKPNSIYFNCQRSIDPNHKCQTSD